MFIISFFDTILQSSPAYGDFAEDHNSTSLESDFCFPAFRFPVIVGRSGLWSTVDQTTAETDGTRNADEA